MRTSIFRIDLAMEGKVDFVKRTSPWEPADDTPQPKKQAPAAKPNPAKAAGQLMSFLRAQATREE